MTFSGKMQLSIVIYLVLAVIAAMASSALEQKGYSDKKYEVISIVVFHSVVAIILFFIWF